MSEIANPVMETNKDEVFIVDAIPEDAAGIVNVKYKTWLSTYPKVVPEHVTKEQIHKEFKDIQELTNLWEEGIKENNPDKRALVAKYQDEVIGFATAKRYKDQTPKIGALYVLEEHQGKGIGKKLINEALTWLDAENEPVVLEVVKGNDDTIDFYERRGFVYSRDMPDYQTQSQHVSIPEVEMIRQPAPIR